MEIYKKALKVQILNEVSLIQVVRKRVRFQDRMNEQINVLLKMTMTMMMTMTMAMAMAMTAIPPEVILSTLPHKKSYSL